MHRVNLNLTHYELGAQYGLRDRMQLSLRVPYDVKAQRVAYTTLTGAPYVPPYGDIHHRTETLTGISDGMMTVEWSPLSQWIVGVGTSLPFGHVVPNPIILGREGRKHEHIQFGSGTFEPDLAVQWSRPVNRFTLFARGEARISLYENREGFRAPNNYLWSAGPSFRLRTISFAPSLQGQYQTIGRWNGEVDEGSGFHNGGVRLQISVPFRGVVIGPGVYRELYSRGLNGETFHQGTTWGVSLTRTF